MQTFGSAAHRFLLYRPTGESLGTHEGLLYLEPDGRVWGLIEVDLLQSDPKVPVSWWEDTAVFTYGLMVHCPPAPVSAVGEVGGDPVPITIRANSLSDDQTRVWLLVESPS